LTNSPPPSFSLVKVNAETAGVLTDWEKGLPISAIAKRHGGGTTDVESLLKTLDRLIQAQAQKHASVLNSSVLPKSASLVPRKLGKLVLNVSNTCELRCRYCYAQHGNYGKHASLMKGNLACIALERVAESFGGIEVIQFFGGEPTLNLSTIELACKHLLTMYQGKKISTMPLLGIVTNGFGWDDTFIEMVGKYNLNVTVSLDGPDKVNDLLRVTSQGKGTLRQIATNIRRLQERSAGRQPRQIELTYTKQHQSLGLSFTDLYSFFANEFGLDDVLIAPVSLSGDHVAYEELAFQGGSWPSPVAEVSPDIVSSWVSEHQRQLNLIYRYLEQLALQRPAPYLCTAGLTNLTIDAGGDIYPCFVLTRDDLKMGNIQDPNVFTSKQFLKVTELFTLHAKSNLPDCPQCWARGFCHICFGVNCDATYSPWTTPAYLCDEMKRSTERVLMEIGMIRGNREHWLRLLMNINRYNSLSNCSFAENTSVLQE